MIPLPRFGEELAPSKPREGERCNGCGYCCAAEVCEIGIGVFGKEQEAPCPAMRFVDGRFLCGVANEFPTTSLIGIYLKLRLGFGVGCDSADPSTRAGVQ